MDMFLSYPDELYSRKVSCAPNLISIFIIFILKIKNTQNREHGKRFLRFYYYHCVDNSAGTLLVPEDIIHPVSQCFSINMVYWIYLSLKLTVPKKCNYYQYPGSPPSGNIC